MFLSSLASWRRADQSVTAPSLVPCRCGLASRRLSATVSGVVRVPPHEALHDRLGIYSGISHGSGTGFPQLCQDGIALRALRVTPHSLDLGCRSGQAHSPCPDTPGRSEGSVADYRLVADWMSQGHPHRALRRSQRARCPLPIPNAQRTLDLTSAAVPGRIPVSSRPNGLNAVQDGAAGHAFRVLSLNIAASSDAANSLSCRRGLQSRDESEGIRWSRTVDSGRS